MTDREAYCKEYRERHREEARQYSKEHRKVMKLRQQLVLAREEYDKA